MGGDSLKTIHPNSISSPWMLGIQQAADGDSASWDSYPPEVLSGPPHAVTRARRKYHCVRCLSSPYGRNHRPSEEKRTCSARPFCFIGLPPHRETAAGMCLLKEYELVKVPDGALCSTKGWFLTPFIRFLTLQPKVAPHFKKYFIFSRAASMERLTGIFVQCSFSAISS